MGVQGFIVVTLDLHSGRKPGGALHRLLRERRRPSLVERAERGPLGSVVVRARPLPAEWCILRRGLSATGGLVRGPGIPFRRDARPSFPTRETSHSGFKFNSAPLRSVRSFVANFIAGFRITDHWKLRTNGILDFPLPVRPSHPRRRNCHYLSDRDLVRSSIMVFRSSSDASSSSVRRLMPPSVPSWRWTTSSASARAASYSFKAI